MVVGIMGANWEPVRQKAIRCQAAAPPLFLYVGLGLRGAIAFLGALIFAELATRHPNAGGKYVYARERSAPRRVRSGWIEARLRGGNRGDRRRGGRICGQARRRGRHALLAAAIVGCSRRSISSRRLRRWVQNLSTAGRWRRSPAW